MRALLTLALAAWASAALTASQAGATVSVWDGVYTADQAARGQQLYASKCAACHGESLGGVEAAPPLTGDQFNSSWTGTPLADLGERIRTSMPADSPGSLTRPQLGELLAYMLKVDGMPPGEKPLDPQGAALNLIRFETNRSQR